MALAGRTHRRGLASGAGLKSSPGTRVGGERPELMAVERRQAHVLLFRLRLKPAQHTDGALKAVDRLCGAFALCQAVFTVTLHKHLAGQATTHAGAFG